MLPQFGFTELILVAIVALIVVGPTDFPVMMRKLGQLLAKARAMASEFRAAFDDIAKQAELDELRKEIEDLKRENEMTSAAKDLRDIEQEINSSIMQEKPAAAEGQTSAEPEPDTKGSGKADPA